MMLSRRATQHRQHSRKLNIVNTKEFGSHDSNSFFIERILLLDEGSIDAMKQHAIETAKQRFVGELYTAVLDRAVNMKL